MHDRSRERAHLKARLLAGVCIHMSAPRRIGKSWVMRRLVEDLAEAGYTAVYFDLQDTKTVEGFYQQFRNKLQSAFGRLNQVRLNATQRLRQATGGFTGPPIDAISGIQDAGYVEFLLAELNGAKKPSFILIDELSLLVLQLAKKDPSVAHNLLYHLRKLQDENTNVRWLYTGSIGLDTVARRHSLAGALVDMELYELPPFDNAAARSFVESEATGATINKFTIGDSAFQHLAEELGWLAPYYLNLIANQISPTGPVDQNGIREATLDDVEGAFNKLLGPSHRPSFAVWEEHIAKNFLEDEQKCVRAILNLCCRTPQGVMEITLLQALKKNSLIVERSQLMDAITALQVNGFLVSSGDKWHFRSGLVRRYWLQYHAED